MLGDCLPCYQVRYQRKSRSQSTKIAISVQLRELFRRGLGIVLFAKISSSISWPTFAAYSPASSSFAAPVHRLGTIPERAGAAAQEPGSCGCAYDSRVAHGDFALDVRPRFEP